MKKYKLLIAAVGLVTTTACSDYLDTSSPSVVDADFVFSNTRTARAAMDGAYEAWRDCAQIKCLVTDYITLLMRQDQT